MSVDASFKSSSTNPKYGISFPLAALRSITSLPTMSEIDLIGISKLLLNQLSEIEDTRAPESRSVSVDMSFKKQFTRHFEPISLTTFDSSFGDKSDWKEVFYIIHKHGVTVVFYLLNSCLMIWIITCLALFRAINTTVTR